MSLSARISNGWKVARISISVIKAHKELLIFPVLSGLSIGLILVSFFGVVFNAFGWHSFDTENVNRGVLYLVMFAFYIVKYFIVVFFNMGLMHAAKLYFKGEEVSISKSLQYSVSRLHYIFLWAVFAATVGTVLRILQDNLGWVGKLLIGILGIAWSAATFFVIPVLAYENVGPAEALKRSASLMKQKWGEGITANFSIGLIGLAAVFIVAVASMGISALLNEQAGVIIFAIGILFLVTLGSALHSIIISAIYNEVNDGNNQLLGNQLLNDLFVEK